MLSPEVSKLFRVSFRFNSGFLAAAHNYHSQLKRQQAVRVLRKLYYQCLCDRVTISVRVPSLPSRQDHHQ